MVYGIIRINVKLTVNKGIDEDTTLVTPMSKIWDVLEDQRARDVLIDSHTISWTLLNPPPPNTLIRHLLTSGQNFFAR